MICIKKINTKRKKKGEEIITYRMFKTTFDDLIRISFVKKKNGKLLVMKFVSNRKKRKKIKWEAFFGISLLLHYL